MPYNDIMTLLPVCVWERCMYVSSWVCMCHACGVPAEGILLSISYFLRQDLSQACSSPFALNGGAASYWDYAVSLPVLDHRHGLLLWASEWVLRVQTWILMLEFQKVYHWSISSGQSILSDFYSHITDEKVEISDLALFPSSWMTWESHSPNEAWVSLFLDEDLIKALWISILWKVRLIQDGLWRSITAMVRTHTACGQDVCLQDCCRRDQL